VSPGAAVQALDDDGNGAITKDEFVETLVREKLLRESFWELLPRPEPASLTSFASIRAEVNTSMREDKLSLQQREGGGRKESVCTADAVTGMSFRNLRTAYEDILAFVDVKDLVREATEVAPAAKSGGDAEQKKAARRKVDAASVGMDLERFKDLLARKCQLPAATTKAHNAHLEAFFNAVHHGAVADAWVACDKAVASEEAGKGGGGSQDVRADEVMRRRVVDIATRAYCGHWIAAMLLPCCLDKGNFSQRAEVTTLLVVPLSRRHGPRGMDPEAWTRSGEPFTTLVGGSC
jgi:hypothetical protein